MATGRTISANHLTELDRSVLELCKSISLVVKDKITDDVIEITMVNKLYKLNKNDREHCV